MCDSWQFLAWLATPGILASLLIAAVILVSLWVIVVFTWAMKTTLSARIEQHRFDLALAEVQELNNKAPSPEGYCIRPQRTLVTERTPAGALLIRKVVTHYKYFLDGKEVDQPIRD